MKRRVLATVKLDREFLALSCRNREWLAMALHMIASEYEKGEHGDSLVLQILERQDV